jgi:hypothetical protein
MQVEHPSVQSTPILLEKLPDPAVLERMCPRRARLQLDLLLLALEALELGGSEKLLNVAKELELQGIIKNRVNLWRLRNTNPLRRSNQRDPLTLTEAKALVVLVCHQARRLTSLIRQLLLAQQRMQEDERLAKAHHFYLEEYLERFRAHFRARMNPKRSAVVAYNTDEKLNTLALNLLSQLLFCTGTAGVQRLWSSLFDGEVV